MTHFSWRLPRRYLPLPLLTRSWGFRWPPPRLSGCGEPCTGACWDSWSGCSPPCCRWAPCRSEAAGTARSAAGTANAEKRERGAAEWESRKDKDLRALRVFGFSVGTFFCGFCWNIKEVPAAEERRGPAWIETRREAATSDVRERGNWCELTR